MLSHAIGEPGQVSKYNPVSNSRILPILTPLKTHNLSDSDPRTDLGSHDSGGSSLPSIYSNSQSHHPSSFPNPNSSTHLTYYHASSPYEHAYLDPSSGSSALITRTQSGHSSSSTRSRPGTAEGVGLEARHEIYHPAAWLQDAPRHARGESPFTARSSALGSHPLSTDYSSTHTPSTVPSPSQVRSSLLSSLDRG